MDPRRFDAEYLKWTEWQWQDDWPIEDAQDYFTEMYKPKGIDISELHYRIAYSQGDFASFTGRVYLAEWMAAVQTRPDGPTYAERYPALYLACCEDGSYANIRGEDDRRGWSLDWNEGWTGVGPQGIFQHMSEEDWDELVSEQDQEAGLEGEILKYCQAIGRELYDHLRDTYEDMTSEEAFIESCEANEITFDVEIEDEICCED
jgi:hypothetical protein